MNCAITIKLSRVKITREEKDSLLDYMFFFQSKFLPLGQAQHMLKILLFFDNRAIVLRPNFEPRYAYKCNYLFISGFWWTAKNNSSNFTFIPS